MGGKYLGLISSLIGWIGLVIVDVHCLIKNRSGHTGVHLYWYLWVYVAIGIIGMRELKSRVGVLTIAISLIGISFIYLLDYTNKMVEYEVWLSRNMPESGMEGDISLIVYSILLIIFSLFWVKEFSQLFSKRI